MYNQKELFEKIKPEFEKIKSEKLLVSFMQNIDIVESVFNTFAFEKKLISLKYNEYEEVDIDEEVRHILSERACNLISQLA